MNILRLSLFLVFCVLLSCTHGGLRIDELDQPLADIEKAVLDSLPVGKREVSLNGREFFSDYFVVVEKKARAAGRTNVRYYAHVYVLGDRRPYSVEGVIRKQVREASTLGPEYEEAGVDDYLTIVLVKKIKAALSKGRVDRNVIDDFRVF